ncbi:MAG TPA: efflux RND transporter periplasmic adaptor subunit [Methylomirabilota bacterium]|nr:efflux RND transporter periplasmic adaptor subunit [Methylomirabilota bacterium]
MQDRFFFTALGITLAVLAGGCSPASNPGSVSGTIETDEVRVASRYGGRVEKTLAREGDTLKSGQVLVEVEASELRARRDLAAAQLAELEAGPRKEEIDAAKHDWEAIAAELEQARVDTRRAEELFAQKTISQTEREQAATRARMLEKNVAATRSRYDLLLAGSRPERIAQARAQLADIDAQLGEMKITAPSDSVLEVLSVKVGDVLAPNREVATLLLPQHTWVRVYVPEPWLGHLQLAQAVKVRVDSDPGRDFSGTIEQIARDAEFTPRNVQTVGERMKQVFGIKIRLDNNEGKLRAGMAADVTFPGVPK